MVQGVMSAKDMPSAGELKKEGGMAVDAATEVEAAEEAEEEAYGRGKRKIKPTTVVVNGDRVKISNNYEVRTKNTWDCGAGTVHTHSLIYLLHI